MKRMGRIGSFMVSLLLVAAMLCGCGQATDKYAVGSEKEAFYNSSLDDSQNVTADRATGSAEKPLQLTATSEGVAQNRKIIEYQVFKVETKNFDQLMDDIDDTVKQSGGYVESSQIGGNSYYGKENRTAELKIRIPKKNQSDFSDFLSKNCNVVNRSVNTDDVTDRYIDTQSRIKALTLEKETLEKLLTQSSGVSDTLTVYEKLTDVIAEIESYQGKLNEMDNLIEYTTFTIHVDEVERETTVQKQNWFTKTWNGLLNNLSDVGNGFLSIVSFVISALPYLVLLGIVVVVILLIIRRSKKKKPPIQ